MTEFVTIRSLRESIAALQPEVVHAENEYKMAVHAETNAIARRNFTRHRFNTIVETIVRLETLLDQSMHPENYTEETYPFPPPCTAAE